MKPVIMRMVVDLPAPFGPRKPSTSPLSTVNETPFTAIFGPKAFFRFRTSIMENSGQFVHNSASRSIAPNRRSAARDLTFAIRVLLARKLHVAFAETLAFCAPRDDKL